MFVKKDELGKVSNDELACIYAALILVDDDVPVTSEKIETLLNTANIGVESIWPSLYAKALEGINVKQFLIENIVGGTVPATDSSAPIKSDAPAEEALATKQAPPSDDEDSDEDLLSGLSLFD